MARKPEPTISAVLIVKDEEEYLARCLESVRWVDEIVVYDTGSTDRTVEIARQFTDKVIEGYWNDDFGAARNRALEYATSEWVLIVDADEVFNAEPRALRKHLAVGEANFLTVTVSTLVAVPGAVEPPLVSVRVFAREDGTYAGALHEQVVSCPGKRMTIRPLPGASIGHSGYAEGPEAMAARRRRNLEIAVRELEAAEVTERDNSPRLAQRRSNLARALAGVGRLGESLELAERVFEAKVLTDLAMENFATSMAITAAAEGNVELARVWSGRLREIVGNPVWADALDVQIAAVEGSAELVLDTLDRIPTVMVDGRGRRLRRVDYATYEIWALWSLGRYQEAQSSALSAARLGLLPAGPPQLWEWLGSDGVAAVAEALPDAAWRLLGVLCAHAGDQPAAHRVLAVMAEVRPGDLAVLLCARELQFADDLAGLESAARWSARMRTSGLEEYCPLVRLASNAAMPAVQRARAAALALFAYEDSRALTLLDEALAKVDPQDEGELVAQLDVLAPGLVQAA